MSKENKRERRVRNAAIVVYPDSAPDDWIARLNDEHVPAIISPLHDKDVNPDGSEKKSHWHVMVLLEAPKTTAQWDEIWDRVLGDKRVRVAENVNSSRGYARYMCHLDNPEKTRYAEDDVIALGGASYQDLIALPSDDTAMLEDIMLYLREHRDEERCQYLSTFMWWCLDARHDWWLLLSQKYAHLVCMVMKSENARRANRLRVEERELHR